MVSDFTERSVLDSTQADQRHAYVRQVLVVR